MRQRRLTPQSPFLQQASTKRRSSLDIGGMQAPRLHLLSAMAQVILVVGEELGTSPEFLGVVMSRMRQGQTRQKGS